MARNVILLPEVPAVGVDRIRIAMAALASSRAKARPIEKPAWKKRLTNLLVASTKFLQTNSGKFPQLDATQKDLVAVKAAALAAAG